MVSQNPGIEPFQAYLAVFSSWTLAQIFKVLRGVFQEKRFDFRWCINTGGMPSSHAAGVASLTTVIGFYYGFGSIPFGMSLVYSLIIMFDAAGVRRSVGRQAIALNKIVDELSKGQHLEEKRVREFLGHTPKEVLVGAFLGIVISMICKFY